MCPGLQGRFAASLLETLRPAHGERRGLSAFPRRKEGWDFTLVLGRKTLPSLCCARCASKAPSATSPAPGELQWFSPGVLHCGVTRSWVWQVSPCGSAASAPWLPQLEARVTREPLCCQSHEGTVAWELPSSCLGATMAPGHRLALPARESSGCFCRSGWEGWIPTGETLCVRLPGCGAAARGDLLGAFQKQQNLG